MTSRQSLLLAAAGALTLAGCDSKSPAPQPPQSPPSGVAEPTAAPPTETAAPSPEPTMSSPVDTPVSTPTPLPDHGALNERRDPDKVLRFYADALAARDWASAAKVWGEGSGVTAKTLKASYDRDEPPRLTIGKGDQEGAAGSLYYEAPVTLRFGSAGEPQKGTLLLRRVNDVDGATPEQLRWHLEKSTIGAQG